MDFGYNKLIQWKSKLNEGNSIILCFHKFILYRDATLPLFKGIPIFSTPRLNFKKNHHRSIHNIRLQKIIDNQVFKFSNTCTVGASIRVVTVYMDPGQPTTPPASGRVLECLPATACGPTAPVSHRLNFTPYISFLYIPLETNVIGLLYTGSI